MKTQQPEALIFANDRPTSLDDDLYQWSMDAEDLIRRQHACIAELEAELADLSATPPAPAVVAVPDERSAFEAWAESVGLDHLVRGFGKQDDYAFVETRRMWEAWQAARRVPVVPEGLIEKVRQLRGLVISHAYDIPDADPRRKQMWDEHAAYAGEVLGFLLAAPSQTTENSIKEVMGLINKLVTAEFISEYSGSEEEDIEVEVLIIKCRKSIESKLRELLQ